MLLSIDRVLQLLAEGKSISKISELANCDTDDVIDIIEDARKLLSKHQKALSKKKVIIKKPKSYKRTESQIETNPDSESLKSIFNGAELSAVPLSSLLVVYACGYSQDKQGPSGIGIVIYDKDDHQVGKVSTYIGKTSTNQAIYRAIIRALKIAIYFKTNTLKLRTDSEFIVNQINGEQSIDNQDLKKMYNEIHELIDEIPHCTIEHVTKNFSEKAEFLAEKASGSRKKHSGR